MPPLQARQRRRVPLLPGHFRSPIMLRSRRSPVHSEISMDTMDMTSSEHVSPRPLSLSPPSGRTRFDAGLHPYQAYLLEHGVSHLTNSLAGNMLQREPYMPTDFLQHLLDTMRTPQYNYTMSSSWPRSWTSCLDPTIANNLRAVGALMDSRHVRRRRDGFLDEALDRELQRYPLTGLTVRKYFPEAGRNYTGTVIGRDDVSDDFGDVERARRNVLNLNLNLKLHVSRGKERG